MNAVVDKSVPSNADADKESVLEQWESHLSKITLEFELARESIEIEKIWRELSAILESAKSKKIAFLHTYNDVKDSTQLLIGSLAYLKGVTSKRIHEDLGLI